MRKLAVELLEEVKLRMPQRRSDEGEERAEVKGHLGRFSKLVEEQLVRTQKLSEVLGSDFVVFFGANYFLEDKQFLNRRHRVAGLGGFLLELCDFREGNLLQVFHELGVHFKLWLACRRDLVGLKGVAVDLLRRSAALFFLGLVFLSAERAQDFVFGYVKL